MRTTVIVMMMTSTFQGRCHEPRFVRRPASHWTWLRTSWFKTCGMVEFVFVNSYWLGKVSLQYMIHNNLVDSRSGSLWQTMWNPHGRLMRRSGFSAEISLSGEGGTHSPRHKPGRTDCDDLRCNHDHCHWILPLYKSSKVYTWPDLCIFRCNCLASFEKAKCLQSIHSKEQPTSRYLLTSIGRSGPTWHFQMFCRKSFLCARNLNPLSISRLPSRRNIAPGKSVNQIFGIAFSVNTDFVKFLFYDVVI